MERADTMSGRQYLAACCASLFSPLSRLLPKAVIRTAGFSGWISPLFALPFLLLLILSLKRMLRIDGRTVGLAEALCLRLGSFGGKLVTALLALWLLFYGGFVLRSGAERLLSTVYQSGRLAFFLPVLLALSSVMALGSFRMAGRSAVVSLLLFGCALALTFALALPTVQKENLVPLNLSEPGRLLLSAVPVLDVLSPWVYFSFLRHRISEDGGSVRRGIRCMCIMLLLASLFLFSTIGILGAELCLQQQFPFFVMTKKLALFRVVERFDAVVVAIWMLSDNVCIGMILLSAGEAFGSLRKKIPGKSLIIMISGCVCAISFAISPDAFSFGFISDYVVPLVNLSLSFLILPLLSLLPPKKTFKKLQKRC